MPIADMLSRGASIRLDGRDWPVIFTHRVLIECEQMTGLNLLNGGLVKPSATLFRSLVYVALKRSGAQFTIGHVGGMISASELGALQRTLVAAWCESMPDPEKEEPGEKAGQKIAWLDAWAIARQDLRISDDEWLDMTPRMVQALRKRQLQNLQDQEFMLSRLTAITANFSPCGPKEPYQYEYFMLHPYPKRVDEAAGGTPGDRLMAALKGLPAGAAIEAK